MVDYQSYVRTEPERLTVTAETEAVRRFAAAIGDAHPAHGRADGATMPPTFAFALAMAGAAFPFPTDGLIHAEQGFAFDRPLPVGRPIVVERGLRRARQRGSGDGAMWILTWEAAGFDEDGGRLFAMNARLLARPGTPQAAAPPADPRPAAAPHLALRGPEAVLDHARIAAYAAASGDRNPIHLDDAEARRYGLAGVVAHGMLSLALVATLAEDWAAAGGLALTGLTGRFVAPVRAGERVVAVGEGGDGDESAFALWSVEGDEKVRATAARGPMAPR